MDHEFWRVVAGGFLDTLVGYMTATTDRDARRLLIDCGAYTGKLLDAMYASLGYVPSTSSVQKCLDYIQDPYYNPAIREDVEQITNAAVDGTTLTCDAPAEGSTVYVYDWDYTEFSELGPLAENSQPGAGVYVLVARNASGNNGLPSAFLTIS